MASIYREFNVDAPVEKVWAAIADVGAPDKIISFLSNVTLEGNRRSLQLGDMGKVEELIVSIDQDHRRVAYSIRESPLNLVHHNASMQAHANDRGGTRFIWITDVQPDEAAAPEIIDSAIKSIKEALRS